MAAQDPYTKGSTAGTNVAIDAIDFQTFAKEQDMFFSESLSMSETLQEIGLEVLQAVAQDSVAFTTYYAREASVKKDIFTYNVEKERGLQEEPTPYIMDAVSIKALNTPQEDKNAKDEVQYPDSVYSKIYPETDDSLAQGFDRSSQKSSLDSEKERQESIRQSIDSESMYELSQMSISKNIFQHDVYNTKPLLIESSQAEIPGTTTSFDAFTNKTTTNDLSIQEAQAFSNQENVSTGEGQQVVNLVTTIDLDGQVLCEMFERYLSTQALRA